MWFISSTFIIQFFLQFKQLKFGQKNLGCFVTQPEKLVNPADHTIFIMTLCCSSRTVFDNSDQQFWYHKIFPFSMILVGLMKMDVRPREHHILCNRNLTNQSKHIINLHLLFIHMIWRKNPYSPIQNLDLEFLALVSVKRAGTG